MKTQIAKGMVATALLVMTTFACNDKFLNIPATGQLAGTQLTSRAGLDGLLISAYSQLNARGFTQTASSNNWTRDSISGGDANKGSNSGDFNAITPYQRYELLPSSNEANGKWNAMYEVVSRANSVLRALKTASADVSEADKMRIAAEARFLRGHYYFELKQAFNMVPYVDEMLDYGSGIEKMANDKDIWTNIEADFKYAYENLSATQGAIGRANKWAAASYLAKSYMYEKKYAEAKALFDVIIASGTTSGGKKYGLVAKYANVFNAEFDNNEKSIFAMQAAANTGSSDNANPDLVLNFPYNTGSNGPAGCCGFSPPASSWPIRSVPMPMVCPCSTVVTIRGPIS